VDTPVTYVIAHLHEALLKDDRFSEQALEIEAVERRVVLRGEVATPERHAGIVELVTELLPDWDVVDDICVSSPTHDPGEAEVL
jgi:hypothetical protein